MSKKRPSILKIVIFVLFVVYAFVLTAPLLYALFNSLRLPSEYVNSKPLVIPEVFSLENYKNAWTVLQGKLDASVPKMFFNSVWYSVGMCFFSLFFSSMSAYVVAKYDFPWKKFIYAFALVSMMIPIMGSLPSQIRFADMFGAYNSPMYVIIQAQVLGTVFIIMYSTFRSISWEYAEAAFIDGANDFTVYFRVMLPQAASPIAALFLTNFIWLWADAETPLIFFESYPTLSVGLYSFIQHIERATEPILYAGLVLCLLPSLILYIAFQHSLMDIQMGGGIKG